MFRTILVPLDGSSHAERALPYAIEEARHHRAGLVLIHVIPRPEPCTSTVRRSGPLPWRAAWPEAEIAAAERAGSRYLDGVIGRHGLPPGTETRIAVGDPVRRLSIEAASHDLPLLVMTTGDTTGGGTPPLSEVARRLLVGGTIPVLGVRAAPSSTTAVA